MHHRDSSVSIIALALFFSGCYASYLHEPDGTFDGGTLRDGSVDAPRDAPIGIDAPRPEDAGTCPGYTGVVVRVEPVTADVMRCTVAHAEGVQVLGVDAAPADYGVRIHTDLCPGADADCRCDFVVGNVGVGLADLLLMPAAGNTFDVGFNYLAVRQVPTCECLGCPCAMSLVLEAADGLLESAGAFSSEFTLSAGAQICPEPAACVSATWALHAQALGTETDIPAGEQRELGIVHVQSVRDVDIFGPCAACATCGSPQASWVAWVRH